MPGESHLQYQGRVYSASKAHICSTRGGCALPGGSLTVEKANKSDHLADYLDLTFIIDSGGKLSTRLYDKRDMILTSI